jgi:hypothetical protein
MLFNEIHGYVSPLWESRIKIDVFLGQIKLEHANFYVKELQKRWRFTIFICQGEKKLTALKGVHHHLFRNTQQKKCLTTQILSAIVKQLRNYLIGLCHDH